MSKMLITGGSGFVGSNLARFFGKRKSVFASKLTATIAPYLCSSGVNSVQLDVRDANAVFSAFEEILPEIVIHAAGNKNVKYCENHPDEAYETNAIGTKNIARGCRKIGAKMIYISTDLVFSCTDGGYKETDSPQPTTVYGKTKLQGEILAQQELDKVAICRSGGIYGKGSPLLQWLSVQLEAGEVVECFTDVFNTPTYVDNLAEAIEEIAQQGLTGIYHTVGQERVSRFQFFKYYATTFGLNPDLILPVEGGDRRCQMLLQPDASLSNDKTSAILGVNFNCVTEGFNRLKLSGGL